MSLKNPVTPPGIDPGTVRLVAQRLNHYATPGPSSDSRKEETARKHFCVIYWMGKNVGQWTEGGNESPCTQNTGHVHRTVAGVKWKDNI
jgi:hypothetical protein